MISSKRILFIGFLLLNFHEVNAAPDSLLFRDEFCEIVTYYQVSSQDYLTELKPLIEDDLYQEVLAFFEQSSFSSQLECISNNYFTSITAYSWQDGKQFDRALGLLFLSGKLTILQKDKRYKKANVKVKRTKSYSCCGRYRSGSDWSIFDNNEYIAGFVRRRNGNAYRWCTCIDPVF